MPDQLTVCGLDLSLTSTGVAKVVGGALGGDPWTFRIRSARRGWERMDSMLDRISRAVQEIDPDVTIVEGPAYSRALSSHFHEGAGLWWLATHWLWKSGLPFTVIPPTVLKKWATGKGNADKSAVCVAAATRFRLAQIDPDEADALWAAAAACQHYGLPLVSMPALNISAIEGLSAKKLPTVNWPKLRQRTTAG